MMMTMERLLVVEVFMWSFHLSVHFNKYLGGGEALSIYSTPYAYFICSARSLGYANRDEVQAMPFKVL